MDKFVIERPLPSVGETVLLKLKFVRYFVDEDYDVEFGFIFVVEKGEHRPKCVICLYLYSGLIIQFKIIQIAQNQRFRTYEYV